MLSLDVLRNAGEDVATGLANSGNDEASYLRLVEKALHQYDLVDLGEMLDGKDYDLALEEAKKVQEAYAFLGLTSFTTPLNELIQKMSAGADEYSYLYLLAKLKNARLNLLVASF